MAPRGVYAAGPIDAVTLDEARDWQAHLASLVPKLLIFSPAHPYWNASIETAETLDTINRAAIDVCRCLVAYLPEGRPAFGTVREIEYSVMRSYPTCVVAPGLKSLLRYDFHHVETLAAAADWLRLLSAES